MSAEGALVRAAPVVVVLDADPDRQCHVAELLGPGVRTASGATGLTRVLATCDRRRPVVVVLGLVCDTGDGSRSGGHAAWAGPIGEVRSVTGDWPSPTAVVGVTPRCDSGDLAAALRRGLVDLVALDGPTALLRHAVRRAGTALMASGVPAPRSPVVSPLPGRSPVGRPDPHRNGSTTSQPAPGVPGPSDAEGASPPADHQMDTSAAPPPPRHGGRVAVLSAKGGAGASTVAANVAVLLTTDTGHVSPPPVVVVDGDLQFGDLSVLFDVAPRATLASVLRCDGTAPLATDARLSHRLVTNHDRTGVGVVCAPTDLVAAEQLAPGLVTAVLDHLGSRQGWVVIDLWSRIDDVVADVVTSADVVVIVTTLDLAAVKDTGLAVRTLVRLGVPAARFRLVCNAAGRPGDVEVHQAETHVGLPVAAVVPRDDAVPLAVRRGVPVVVDAPHSRAAVGLAAVAATVAGSPPPADAGQVGGVNRGRPRWGRLRRHLQHRLPTGGRTPLRDG